MSKRNLASYINIFADIQNSCCSQVIQEIWGGVNSSTKSANSDYSPIKILPNKNLRVIIANGELRSNLI